jgi:DNA-binding SARP family transcriptional activator/predicted ATPase
VTRLDVCMFGPLQVTVDEQPATGFASDKVRALLAYLAVEAEWPHRREKLAGLLWPDQPERSARANLRRALSNLRLVIGDRARSSGRAGSPVPAATPPTLLVTRQTIQFNRESDAWVDITAFAELVNEQMGKSANGQLGRWANEQRGREAGGGIGELEEAVALYRGGFLEGFSLAGCPAFEEWMLFEGERLHRLALEALHRLVEGYEARGELERALPHAWRQLELDPWWESAHQQVMRLLACGGQRAEALAQYETCRQRLAEGMGVEPSAETVALYERILDGREGPAPAAPAVPHNLPAPLTPFIGRKAELAELEERLRDPGCRLVTLVGPGGIGKTRLALEAARGCMENYPHGVFQVRLVGLQSTEGIVPAIAQAIGFSFYREGEPKQQLLDYLRAKRMLLLLDNFEHLLAGVGEVVDILRAAPETTMIVTSRARLNLKGEQLFPIEGLPYPPSDALEIEEAMAYDAAHRNAAHQNAAHRNAAHQNAAHRNAAHQNAAEYDAVKLFVSGARRVCPGFRLDGHTGDVVRICQVVAGMPLALLLASAWVGTMSPRQIADQVSDGVGRQPSLALDLLETGWGDVPERHRSIRAVFGHSWNLLSGRERQIFAALSVFRGGFSAEAAGAVAGASTGELRALADKSFVQRLPTGRYEVHELLRQYGADQLRRAGKLRRADRLRRAERLAARPEAWDSVHDRHCAHYAAALQRWAEELKGARQLVALAKIEADADNARAAWAWATERRQVARLDQALDGLCMFYEWRVRYREGEAACRLAAGSLAAETSEDGLCVLARILAWQAAFNRLLGRAQVAGPLLRQGQALLEDPRLAGQDTRREHAFLLLQRGLGTLDSENAKARRLYQRSLALYRSVGDRWETANVLDRLAWVARYLGASDEARKRWQESLALRQALGDQQGIADSLGGLGSLALYQGRLDEGERLHRESTAMLQKMGNRAAAARGLAFLGTQLYWLGKLNESHSLLEESVALASELGLRSDLALWSTFLGNVKLFLGRYEGARAQGEMALALSRETGCPRGTATACRLLGLVALTKEAYAEAHGWLERGATLLQEIGFALDLALTLGLLAHAARGMGDIAGARGHLHEALRLVAETRQFMSSLFALPAAALLLADAGEVERAVELYALASRYGLVGNSQFFEDIAGRQIAAAAAELPAEVVAAAQARGRARDLEATVMELLEELEG